MLAALVTKEARPGTLKVMILLFRMALPFGSLDGDYEAGEGTRGLLLAIYFLRVFCLLVVPVLPQQNFFMWHKRFRVVAAAESGL